MENNLVEVKSVDAYVNKNGKINVRLKLANDTVCFVSQGLINYACEHAKETKAQD